MFARLVFPSCFFLWLVVVGTQNTGWSGGSTACLYVMYVLRVVLKECHSSSQFTVHTFNVCYRVVAYIAYSAYKTLHTLWLRGFSSHLLSRWRLLWNIFTSPVLASWNSLRIIVTIIGSVLSHDHTQKQEHWQYQRIHYIHHHRHPDCWCHHAATVTMLRYYASTTLFNIIVMACHGHHHGHVMKTNKKAVSKLEFKNNLSQPWLFAGYQPCRLFSCGFRRQRWLVTI